MTDKDGHEVRRLGRQQRKNRLQKPTSLFAEDEQETSEMQIESAADPDINTELDLQELAIPNTDADALELLSQLQGEIVAPVITPADERYPPLHIDLNESASPADSPPPPKNSSNRLYNGLATLFLLLSCGVVAWVVQVWNDPQSFFNPLPPATPYIEITATPFGQINATPDETGQIFIVITQTPDSSNFPFVAEDVLYAPNTNDYACNWWSIAGTVLDKDGNALNGYRIRVQGDDLSESVFSGTSQAFGAGGFELPLIGTPSAETFVVQLLSVQGTPLSAEVIVITKADCDANVTIINFRENR